MVLSEANAHILTSRRMLTHAEEQLEADDLVQASEKGWGAVAHYLKAVAKQRGWTNRSHRDFFVIKDRLADEMNDTERMHELFRTVRGLHANFYEPWYPEHDVRDSIVAAKEFIDRLEQASVLDR